MTVHHFSDYGGEFDFSDYGAAHPTSPAFDSDPGHQLEVRVAAEPSWLSSVRVLAADLATRADFDLDAVADLRMAVDEACATLIRVAVPGTMLCCRFAVGADRITLTAAVPVPAATTLSRRSFGWRVLATLADEVELLTDGAAGADRPGPALGIRLSKLRRVEAP